MIPDMRLSPVCSARANTLRGQRRTADPIPDWLRVPTWLTFHRAGATVNTCGSDLGVPLQRTVDGSGVCQPCDAGGARHTGVVGFCDSSLCAWHSAVANNCGQPSVRMPLRYDRVAPGTRPSC